MSLSFCGFLTKYCKELTGKSTSSLKKLFASAEKENPRAFEPILLLAIKQNREEYLLKQAAECDIYKEYKKFLSDWKKSDELLEDYLLKLSKKNRYRRPLDSWIAQKHRLSEDREILKQVSKTFCALLDTKGISRAEACRKTNLNKGNFYAFLKGDTSKLSRKTATEAYRLISESDSRP